MPATPVPSTSMVSADALSVTFELIVRVDPLPTRMPATVRVYGPPAPLLMTTGTESVTVRLWMVKSWPSIVFP